MPNLQQIKIGNFGGGNNHKWRDGEDPGEELNIRTANRTTHDIEIISNFGKLRILEIYNAQLNGRYHFLFSSFPLLQKLSIKYCNYLKFDLEMLAGFPVLKELDCDCNRYMTGNISSLTVLKDTIEKVAIVRCHRIEGNFMDLADFPHLKILDIDDTAVTGDIRDIGEDDFSSLEQLKLPKGVYGGTDYELQRISDAPDLVRSLYLFKKQRPSLKMKDNWCGVLSEDSPDWYEPEDEDEDELPPFYIHFVKAGSRIGYRWETNQRNPCEVNWLDPEPDKESSDYARYIGELRDIEWRLNFYKGFHQPPTEEEYNRLYNWGR